MKTKWISLVFLGLFGLSARWADKLQGQTVSPVSSQTQLQAPYLYNLHHWANIDDDRLQVRLRLLDTKVPNATLYLRMRMVSENLSVENGLPLPIAVSLSGGEEVLLRGQALRPYFTASNLQINGNGKQALLQSGGMLPDGLYRLSFEVYEARSGNKVSVQESPALFRLVAGEPPLINAPQYGSTFYYGKQEVIRFQWTPRHQQMTGAFNTRYTFELAQIPEGAQNWKEYFHTLPLIAKENVEQPFFDYGPQSPQLIPGHRYAFRVRAECRNAANESLYIKNDGYSEVFLLHYEERCPIVPQLRIEKVRSTTATLTWTETEEAKEYKLQYRKNGNPNARWFNFQNPLPAGSTNAVLENLEPGTGYECRLLVKCAYSQSENDAVYRFTTLSNDNAGLQCGKHERIDTVSHKEMTPLPQLRAFDQVRTASGFVFEIERVNGGADGRFSGEAYTHVPLLSNTGVKVKFNNIFVNKNYELVSGTFVAVKSKKDL